MHLHRTVRGITLVVLLTGVLAGVGFTMAAADDDDSRRRGHSDRSRDDDSGNLARALRKLEQFVVLRVGQLTAQLRELTTRMEGLTQRANDAQRADDLLAQRVDDLTLRYNDLATRITTVDGKIATVDGRITGLDGKVSGLDGRVTGLDGKVSAVDARVTGLDGTVSGLDGRVTGLDGKVSAVDGRVTGLDGQVSGLDARVTGLDGQVSGLDGRVTGLDGRVTGLEGQATTMSSDLASVTDSVGTLTRRVDELASSGLAVMDARGAKVGDYVGMDSNGTLMIGMLVADPDDPTGSRSYSFVLQLFPDRLVGNTIYFLDGGCGGPAFVAAGFPKPRSSLSLAGVTEPGGTVYVSEANVSPAVIKALSSIPTTSPNICVVHNQQFGLNVLVLPAKPVFVLDNDFVRPFVVK
jgi:TolA-binding protein